MPRIVSTATAVPPHEYSQSEIRRGCVEFLGMRPEDLSLLILEHSGVEHRHFCFPAEYYLARHSFERRNRDYVEQALGLSERAIRVCLERGGFEADQIDHILLITTTGLATPSLEAMLTQRIPLSFNVRRTPIFGVGCAGGAVGLSRAADYLRGYSKELSLLVSVELCGQNLDLDDRSKLAMVGLSLFGDGAAAVLLAGDERQAKGPECIGSHSVLFPDSLDIMGWDFTDQGMRLVLSRRLPSFIGRTMPGVIKGFLTTHGLSLDEVKYWVVHPGSGKVMDAFERALGFSPVKFRWAREFLRRYGNLSSASVLFILNEIFERGDPQPGDYGLVTAVGPGFSAELVLLKW